MGFLDKGGLMDTSLKIMTGYNSDVYSTDDKNFENIINNLAKNNNKNYILTCGRKHSKYSNFCDSNKQFYAGHAYAIKNIDSKRIFHK